MRLLHRIARGSLALWTLLLMSLAGGLPAMAAGVPLSDEELSEVVGQGMLELSNTSYGGYDFMRITLSADIALSATLSGVSLGQYSYAGSSGSDIAISTLSLGSSSGDTVSITDPYVEFVFKGSGSTREIVGLRLGFGSIGGNLSLVFSSLSGSILIDGGTAGVADLSGKRIDGSCATGTSNCLPMNTTNSLVAGSSEGGSRDVWLSLLKESVQFAASSGMAAPEVAQAGYWLNWRDRLSVKTGS